MTICIHSHNTKNIAWKCFEFSRFFWCYACCVILCSGVGCTRLPKTARSALPDPIAISENATPLTVPTAENHHANDEKTNLTQLNASEPQLLENLTDEEAIEYAAYTTNSDHPSSSALTISMALQVMLENNPLVRQAQLSQEMQQTLIDESVAEFDTTLSSNLDMRQVNQQASSAIDALGTGQNTISTTNLGNSNGPDLLAFGKKWETGTQTRLAYGSNYNNNNPSGSFLLVNPAYSSNLSLSVSQPLWQGRNQNVNEAPIAIAKLNQARSKYETRETVTDLIVELHAAYWSVYQLQQELTLIQQELSDAEHLHHEEEVRLKLGEGSMVRLTRSLDYVQQLKIELAQVEQRASEAEQRLFLTMGIDQSQTSIPRQLIAEPNSDLIALNVESSREQALQNRNELKIARQKLKTAELQRLQAEDLTKPSINVVGRVGVSGLDSNAFGAIQNASSGNYHNWMMGLNYERKLGKRGEQALLKRAELQFQSAMIELRKAENIINYDVDQSLEQVRKSYEIYQAQLTRSNLLKEQLDIYNKLYHKGQITIEQLVESRGNLLSVQREELLALVNYNLSIVVYHRSIGDLTHRHSI
ncbi:Outer membrane efflux protein [Rubinisphaera italica]|uniref:Outer membrane efflux protein n=1 Tax=Rubinisphaera italica TaxID=2527969 RepID=A0A5C5XFC5_9PLAN|nr:Outer membrane efflux protein [Rubinisphaera italica]